MAAVRFLRDFDWHPTPRSTIAYKAGMVLTVKRACAQAAVAAGVAEEIDPPRSLNVPGSDERAIALVLGGAQGIWDDLDAARELLGDAPARLVAANYAGIDYPGALDAWVTLHPERFDAWRDERDARGYPGGYRIFIHEPWQLGGAEAVAAWSRCSSGGFAAQCALERMNASGVILCGVPMDNSGGHIHHDGDWTHRDFYVDGFETMKAKGLPIRSVSGWTRELFGAPDADWIAVCR